MQQEYRYYVRNDNNKIVLRRNQNDNVEVHVQDDFWVGVDFQGENVDASLPESFVTDIRPRDASGVLA